MKILLVEDDEDDYFLTRELLSEVDGLHYTLKWIKTYDEALREIRSGEHDLYLVDYRLGERTGLDVLKEAVKADCRAPIILMTGQGGREVDMMAMKAGASDYLVKGTFDAALLDRAIRYAVERKRSDAELKRLHQELLKMSRQAGMAEVASGILHNVGNILNSINVSAATVIETVSRSKTDGLARVVAMLSAHRGNLGAFLTEDEKGRRLPDYLKTLSEHLSDEQQRIRSELASLSNKIGHVKNIIAMQNNIGAPQEIVETVSAQGILEEVLKMMAHFPEMQGIRILREYQDVPALTVNQHKLLQILMNLVRNAAQALAAACIAEKTLTVALDIPEPERIQIKVIDNGVGISEAALAHLFSQGFTTKKDGHGLGLHHSALNAKELGGVLRGHSDGPDLGAEFTLVLPLKPPARDSENTSPSAPPQA